MTETVSVDQQIMAGFDYLLLTADEITTHG